MQWKSRSQLGFKEGKKRKDSGSIRPDTLGGTFKSLCQILSNWDVLCAQEGFLHKREKNQLEELKEMIGPIHAFQVTMQGRKEPLQVKCILQLFKIWEDLDQNRWTHKTAKSLAHDIRTALKKRYFQKYLEPDDQKLVWERCLLLSPDYSSLEVIRGWMSLSGLFDSNAQVDKIFIETR